MTSGEGEISQTIEETAWCPEELRRGDCEWNWHGTEVLQALSEAATSVVLRCKCSRTGYEFVVKSYSKEYMTKKDCEKAGREIDIHSRQQHPHIVQLFAAFEDLSSINLVQEFASRGNLMELLSAAGGVLPEDFVAFKVAIPVLAALSHLHFQGVTHRDLKPENVLLRKDGSAALVDFGLAINEMTPPTSVSVGTLDYFAPEMVPNIVRTSAAGSKAIPGAVDVWALGIMIYELLVGAPPFESETQAETFDAILQNEPFLPSMLSSNAQDFIMQALTKDQQSRPTAKALCNHAWFRDGKT